MRRIAKYALIVSTLLIVSDTLIEQITYSKEDIVNTNLLGILNGTYLAYLAVPFFISSALFVAYVYSYRFVKIAWRDKRVRVLSVLAGLGYASFYVFTTDMVGTPNTQMPPNLGGIVSIYLVYDHLTTWPSLYFWSPQLNLWGGFSLGSVLVVLSVGVLTAFSVALLSHNMKNRIGKQSAGPLAGSLAVSLSTSAFGCCSPLVLPLLLASFGFASTNSMVENLIFQTSPLFNLLWVGTIGLLLATVFLSSNKVR